MLAQVLHQGRHLFHQQPEGALHQRMVVRVLGYGQQMPESTHVGVELADLVLVISRFNFPLYLKPTMR